MIIWDQAFLIDRVKQNALSILLTLPRLLPSGVSQFYYNEGRQRDFFKMSLLPEYLDDFFIADNPVRFVEAFIDSLDIEQQGFAGAVPPATGRPAYQ